MGQHCREAVSCLRANVESLHKDRFIAQDTKETSVHSPRDLGVPLGAPPWICRFSAFRHCCYWKCTSKARYIWHGFYSPSMRNHKSLLRRRWRVKNKFVMVEEEEVIITREDTSLDRGCPQEQYVPKKGWKVLLGSFPWNKKWMCKIGISKKQLRIKDTSRHGAHPRSHSYYLWAVTEEQRREKGLFTQWKGKKEAGRYLMGCTQIATKIECKFPSFPFRIRD